MENKLRKKYSLLTLSILIVYIAISLIGWLNVGNYDDVGNTMLYFGIFGCICSVFAALALFVCIPKQDEYAFKTKKEKVVAEVAAISTGSPIGGIGNGYKVGPRARYIIPILILGAILILGSTEMLPLFIKYEASNTGIIYLAFILSWIAEIIAIYATFVCSKYNQVKLKN